MKKEPDGLDPNSVVDSQPRPPPARKATAKSKANKNDEPKASAIPKKMPKPATAAKVGPHAKAGPVKEQTPAPPPQRREENELSTRYARRCAAKAEHKAAKHAAKLAKSAGVEAEDAPAKGPRVVQAACVDATKGWEVKDINNAWAAYKRTFQLPESGTSEQVKETKAYKEKCPLSESLRILGNIEEESRWFDLWLKGNRKWAKALFEERQRLEKEKTEKKNHAWLTFGQLLKLYKSSTVAEAIRDSKLLTPDTWRQHPEVPDCEEAIQFYCFVEESKKELVKQILQQDVLVRGEAAPEAAKAVGDKLLAGTGWTNAPEEPPYKRPREDHAPPESPAAQASDAEGSVPSDPRSQRAFELLKAQEDKEKEKETRRLERIARTEQEKADRKAVAEAKQLAEQNDPVAKSQQWLLGA